jgi:serine/threonine protein kinase
LPTKINSTWLPINLEGNKRVFVELIRLPKPIVDSSGENGLLSSARKEVLGLTSILSHVQSSSMHIFRAEHFFDESGVPGAPFGIVYSWPANISSPVTLLDLLHGQSSDGTKLKPHHPLEDRICIAKHILTAILFMHSSGWVHKSIRSENVLVAHPSASSSGNALGSAYLKGFEFSRRSIAASTGWDDVRNWKRDIYVHPARLLQIEARKDQPQTGERKYRNVFDVYSFGVVCLELGLWKPLDAQGAIFEKAQAGKMKEILYEIARSKIPPLLGTKFVNVIYSCLTAPGDLSDEGANDLLCEVMNDLDSISI